MRRHNGARKLAGVHVDDGSGAQPTPRPTCVRPLRQFAIEKESKTLTDPSARSLSLAQQTHARKRTRTGTSGAADDPNEVPILMGH